MQINKERLLKNLEGPPRCPQMDDRKSLTQ